MADASKCASRRVVHRGGQQLPAPSHASKYRPSRPARDRTIRVLIERNAPAVSSELHFYPEIFSTLGAAAYGSAFSCSLLARKSAISKTARLCCDFTLC